VIAKVLSLLAWTQSQQDGVTFIDITPREPQHGIVWVILSTFALIAIAFVVTLGIGVGTGFLRIWIFKLFPGNKLNGPEYEPTTQLHLLDRTKSPGPPG
jgi:hypothetical protein